jgi:hypothetical protein
MSYKVDVMIGYGIVIPDDIFIDTINLKYSTDEDSIETLSSCDAIDIVDKNYKSDLLKLFTFFTDYTYEGDDILPEHDDQGFPAKYDISGNMFEYEYYNDDGSVNENHIKVSRHGVLIWLNELNTEMSECNNLATMISTKYMKNLCNANKHDNKFKELCEWFGFDNIKPSVFVYPMTT